MLKKIIALTVLIFVISCNDVIQPIFKEKLVYVVPDLFKEFTPPSDSIVSNRDKQWITNNFNQFIRERKFNGSILIAKNDEIIFDTLIGYTDFKSKKQLADTNAFQLASVSKPITATVILQMVAEGKINLEDKITTFFPFFSRARKVTHIFQTVLQRCRYSCCPNWLPWQSSRHLRQRHLWRMSGWRLSHWHRQQHRPHWPCRPWGSSKCLTKLPRSGLSAAQPS